MRSPACPLRSCHRGRLAAEYGGIDVQVIDWTIRIDLTEWLSQEITSNSKEKPDCRRSSILRQPGFLLSGRSLVFRALFAEGLALSGMN
jgi:hypothetical protein